MAQPPSYTPAADFSEDEVDAAGGRSTVSTAALDAEFAGVATSIRAIRANLSLNQRDDGEIRDERVKLFTLASDVKALLTIGGSAATRTYSAWQTATLYTVGVSIVVESGNTYICAVSHASGTFATDLAAVKWVLVALGSGALASGMPFTPTATLSATDVQAAINESDTENRAALAAAVAAYAAVGGAALVGTQQADTGAVARTQQSKNSDIVSRLDYGSDADFNAAKVGKPSIDSTGRFRAPTLIIGTEEISGATLRDAVVVGRNIVGATNCHDFAARSQLSGVSDAGTFGAFDCTVSLSGTNDQNHLYSFQDRVQLAQSGPGQVRDSAGFMSQAQISGGRILRRYGMFIDPIVVSGGAVVEQQIGLLINHQTGATANVGLNLGQTDATGWAIYAAGGGKSHHLGQFGFGTEPDSGTGVHIAGNGRTVALRIDATSGGYGIYAPTSGDKHYLRGPVSLGLDSNPGTVPLTVTNPDNPANKVAFVSSDLTRGTFGVLGDSRLAFVSNNQAQFVVEDVAGGNAFRPNSDNAQSCGTASFRMSVVYAGTGAINTSDEREKEQFAAASAAEKRVALAIKGALRKFKFKDAVSQKGEAARWHFGAGAQTVAAAFAAEGLNPAAYGMFCFDEWPTTDDTAAGNRYGIRYDELAMFILAAI